MVNLNCSDGVIEIMPKSRAKMLAKKLLKVEGDRIEQIVRWRGRSRHSPIRFG